MTLVVALPSLTPLFLSPHSSLLSPSLPSPTLLLSLPLSLHRHYCSLSLSLLLPRLSRFALLCTPFAPYCSSAIFKVSPLLRGAHMVSSATPGPALDRGRNAACPSSVGPDVRRGLTTPGPLLITVHGYLPLTEFIARRGRAASVPTPDRG